jgi:hypothetical protein
MSSFFFVGRDLIKKVMKKSIAELSEPIPFDLANVVDIMDRDAATLNKD